MRKKQAKKRPLLPDPKFNDKLVTRFVNMLMWSGKKSTAFRIFYDAIQIVESKKIDEEKSALEVWKDALSNVMPHVEVRSRSYMYGPGRRPVLDQNSSMHSLLTQT